MKRREFAGLVGALGAGVLAAPALAAQRPTPKPKQRAPARRGASYEQWIVIDGCGGPGDFTTDQGAPLSVQAVADARSSGVTAVNTTVGPVGARPETEAFAGIARDIGRWQREIDLHPEALVVIRSFADLGTAKGTSKLGLIFGLQDGVSFQLDLTLLEALRGLGVLIIQPTYNLRNLLGDGCLEPADAGLSNTGHAAIERMNELGILVDLSHCGSHTTADALARSTRPVAFTHTGCAALNAHPRNKSDALLRAVADKGGVAGIYVMPYLRAQGQPTADDVVRHIEHALKVMGEDHVGVGTDGAISPVALTPDFVAAFKASVEQRKRAGIGAPGEDLDAYLFARELNTARRLETLANLLAKRRHGSARIEKILGGNFGRVFSEAWKPA